MCFARQAVEVIISEKEKNSAPTKIAPITLVAAKETARRITANKMVPKMPISSADRGVQPPLQLAVR